MQAPLSSTASGQQLRTGPPPGLLPSTTSLHLRANTEPQPSEAEPVRRMRAGSPPSAPWSPLGRLPVSEGAGLAHDAGNLLGALRLYCDLLARPGVLRDEHRHYAEELQMLSRRSGALVDRLLNPGETARRLEDGDGAGTARVSVPGVIEQCRGLLNTIARRAVEVVYGAGAETPVPVGRETVERILVNLTKNAAEASPAGGAITLRVSRLRAAPHGKRRDGSNARVVLSIEDQGSGMSVAAVKVLLEGDGRGAAIPGEEQPQQLHGLGLVSTRGPRRGLGLRVVRELVQASGGELRLNSRSGCGTTVEIAWSVAGVPEGTAFQEEDGGRQAVPAGCGMDRSQGGVAC